MCGIAGIRRFGDKPITGEEIVLLLCSIEHRGPHATGVALQQQNGEINIYKQPIPAWDFTLSDEFKEFLKTHLTPKTQTALLHTRWATVGNPEDNENNHPMFDGSTAIVHNGGISNHTQLFDQGHYTKSCATDSDIIRAIVANHGITEKGIRELSKMSGSAAIACVRSQQPDRLLLARSGSPLVVAFSEAADKLYWASEAQAINLASRPFRWVRGTWVQDTRVNLAMTSMPNDTAWVYDADGQCLHHEFTTCRYYKPPDYSGGRQSYHTKMKNFKNEKKHRRNMLGEEKKLTPHSTSQDGAKRETPLLPVHVKDQKLAGSIISCPSCGSPVQNREGLPWKEFVCPTCHNGIGE
jgi:predicted glutamine amidotransferase